jgi:phosphatidylserine/phosphatidylglycerophosphate/cardiolipin synthase-like enzyme
MQNYKDIKAVSQLLKQAQMMIDKYNLPPQQFLEQLGFLQSQPETEVIFEKSGGRMYLFKALEEAKERVVIKCPWASNYGIDSDFMLRLNYALDQGIQIDIGWGYQYDIGTVISQDRNNNFIFSNEGRYRYSAMYKLFDLQKRYPARLHLKLTGGHSKYFVCDRKFAYIGSHNILSSTISKLKISYPDLKGDEAGTIHRGSEAIERLIMRYNHAPNLANSETNQNMELAV